MASDAPRTVIGLDPGSRVLGYGVVREEGGRIALVDHGAVWTKPKDPIERKLLSLNQQLVEVVDRYRPDQAAVEEVFFSVNARSALLLGQARGVVLLTLAAAGVPTSQYSATALKQAVTNYGRASKAQVQRSVQMLLGLDHLPEPPDAADALAIAICHINSTQRRFQPLG